MTAQERLATPLVIRGEMSSKLDAEAGSTDVPTGEILIDTVSLTFPVDGVSRKVKGSVSLWSETSEVVLSRMQEFVDWLTGGRVFECAAIGGPRNGFENTVLFDDKSGFIAWGGNNARWVGGEVVGYAEERLQIYIDGAGCSRLNSEDWDLFGRRAKHIADSRITRIDVACDLHNGEYGIDDIRAWWEAGLFSKGRRPPKGKFIDDLGSKKGRTFYVGDRDNGLMFRGYEKGRQLGDPESEWTRFEVQFGNKDREIPFEVFASPAEFLSGAYPALSWVSKITQVIRTCREKLDIQFEKLVDIARVQYGKLMHFANRMAGWEPERVFRELVNVEDYPERLKWYVKSHQCKTSITYRGSEYGYSH